MSDGRSNNSGTTGNKGGRKGKAEEQKLIESLTPMNKTALNALKECVKDKQGWAVKLYFEYFYGKPQQKVDVTTNDESLNVPLINFINSES
tara:strand:+ start:176 stop:448 length:273 start_codon:yes stop_codon:yes gene_type:complete